MKKTKKKLKEKVIHTMTISGKDGKVDKIVMPNEAGGDDIEIKISEAQTEPNPIGVLSASLVDELKLKLTWRNVADSLAKKIPIYENECETQTEPDGNIVVVKGEPYKMYVTKIDLFQPELKLFEDKGFWSIMIEKPYGIQIWKMGLRLTDEVINDPFGNVISRIEKIVKRMDEKFSNPI